MSQISSSGDSPGWTALTVARACSIAAIALSATSLTQVGTVGFARHGSVMGLTQTARAWMHRFGAGDEGLADAAAGIPARAIAAAMMPPASRGLIFNVGVSWVVWRDRAVRSRRRLAVTRTEKPPDLC